MPEGTRVHRCVTKLRKKYGYGKAIGICQHSTQQNYLTGKRKTRKKRGGDIIQMVDKNQLVPGETYYYERPGSVYIYQGDFEGLDEQGRAIFNKWKGAENQGEFYGTLGGDHRQYQENIGNIARIWKINILGGDDINKLIASYGGKRRTRKKRGGDADLPKHTWIIQNFENEQQRRQNIDDFVNSLVYPMNNSLRYIIAQMNNNDWGIVGGYWILDYDDDSMDEDWNDNEKWYLNYQDNFDTNINFMEACNNDENCTLFINRPDNRGSGRKRRKKTRKKKRVKKRRRKKQKTKRKRRR